MKNAKMLVISMLLMACATFVGLARQKQLPDVSGTWVGETDFPNTPDKDPLVLVLKKAAASYSGTIAVGAAKPQALENFQIEDEDTFSFEFSISTGDDTTKVKAKLDVIDDKIDGNKLMGAWNMESGDYGSIELIRQK